MAEQENLELITPGSRDRYFIFLFIPIIISLSIIFTIIVLSSFIIKLSRYQAELFENNKSQVMTQN